jgi:hypothetical protein
VHELSPILFAHLPGDAKRGVIGHELSHVRDFYNMSALKLLRTGMGHLSPRFLDHWEYQTDSICIAHGMGNDLRAWSIYVRQALQISNWRGANYIHKPVGGKERYMNPATIERLLHLKTRPVAVTFKRAAYFVHDASQYCTFSPYLSCR